MIGETNHGYCWRENRLWYGDTQAEACTMPMKDGKPCGDSALSGPRCCYAKDSPGLDYDKLTFITYPQANKK